MINLKRTIIKEITVKFQQAWAKPCMSEASSEGKKKKIGCIEKMRKQNDSRSSVGWRTMEQFLEHPKRNSVWLRNFLPDYPPSMKVE